MEQKRLKLPGYLADQGSVEENSFVDLQAMTSCRSCGCTIYRDDIYYNVEGCNYCEDCINNMARTA